MTLLSVSSLGVRFGGVVAVAGVDLAVERAEVIGVIGPNGAGKTTLIDAISGMVPGTGRIIFDGRDVTPWAPHRRARAGMSRSFQTIELFEDLSVCDNLQVAAHRPRWWSPFADLVARTRPAVNAHTAAVIAQLGLGDLADRMPGQLSHGQRNLVSVARALCGRPSLVLLDEPAAGLDTDETAVLVELVRWIAASGIAVLLVDHDMGLVLPACDRIYVMDHGTVIAAGPPAAIRTDPRVIDAYLGQEATE